MAGWEPVVVTRYEYEDGLLVGSVTEQEPEWRRPDVEALIAHAESKRVGPHGHPMDVALSPDGDPSNPDRKWDWFVPLPPLDFAQAELDRVTKGYAEKYPDANMNALRFRVERVPIPDA